MAKWADEAIIVYQSDGRWLAQIKRAPGVHAYADTPGQAVADLAELAGHMDLSDLGCDWGDSSFNPYVPCGSWGCGCCNPHWNERAFSQTETSLGGEVSTITVPQFAIQRPEGER